VGTLAFGGAVATGMMGIGAALGYGFLVVPSAAAGANRIIAALGTQGESAQPGIGHYLEHKFSKAFWEMKKQQAAFDYVLVRDSETNEPVDFYLAPPSYETKNFLTKMLGYKYGSPQAVSGLVDFVLSEAHALQSIHGEESPLIIDDVLEMADRFYAVHELNPEAPSLFYPNGQLTVAGFNTVEAALQDFNPPGLRSIVKETYRARYVHKLVETIESQLRVDGFHGPLLTDEFVMELSGRLCEETADKLPSNPLVVRTLERKDFRPNPAEFLIVGGQILGGIASLPMTPVTILGHVLKAGSTVLFSEDKMKSFGLDDLQEVKMEIDRAIEEASSGDEVVAQMFRMSRLVVSKLEEGVTPFASELGLAVANSLIINAPYIAQQEMDALNIATDTHFVSPEELEALKQNPEMISEEERVQLVNEAERFLNQFGFELIQTDLPLAAKERKWFHYIPSMLLYPRRTTEVLLKTIGTIAGGDEKARRILKGLRCYFENKGLEYAQLNFERARSGLTRFEEFLELQTNNSEVKN
ncbi:MAG: hypothetical protein KDD62_05165, partial [Bdellovibrionales bacterium]|nr:hypothetical protein [Bdellovibrionales bacterium]